MKDPQKTWMLPDCPQLLPQPRLHHIKQHQEYIQYDTVIHSIEHNRRLNVQ